LPELSFRPRDDATMTRTFRKQISKQCATDDAEKRSSPPAASDSRSVMKRRNSFVAAAAPPALRQRCDPETNSGAQVRQCRARRLTNGKIAAEDAPFSS